MLPAVITPVPPLPVMAMETEGGPSRRVEFIASSIAKLPFPGRRRFDLDQTPGRRSASWFFGA
jgi:hypothetical protein